MKRTKIDYGIDLGTTNSAIARVENGEYVIKKALDSHKDTTPSVVGFNRKGHLLVGELAYNSYRSDSLRNLKRDEPYSTYIEFKRTMGSDKLYRNEYVDKSFSSSELSSFVLTRLKEYVQDEGVTAAVITIPAAFKSNQIEATREAAKLAGFSYVEMLQEPIAAATAYSISNSGADGFWLVFDFGGGTFDAALLKVEEGILEVIDTEGDNYLGGKDLDFAIVDEILLPHIAENFVIESILDDSSLRGKYRNAIKFYAENIKNNLSLNSSYGLYVDPGDCDEDDNGEEIEIDITVTQEELKKVFVPIYQKAIDCCHELLKRNNLTGDSLKSLILVGGPTLSPVVREMLSEQICEPDTSMDPMTVVAIGAARYASTIDLPQDIIEEKRDKTKIQLEITHPSSTVEEEEFVAIKLLPEKISGDYPEKLYVQFFENTGSWVGGKVPLNNVGEVVDLLLTPGKTNTFEVKVSDELGNFYDCEPNQFSIIQGSVIGSATLPYNVGIEIEDLESGKAVFRSIQGLEKNKSLPAQGVLNGLRTPKELRPGVEEDLIKIPIYQGEHNADGTRAIYNHHVNTIYITGESIPGLLPKDSEVDINLKIDRSQKMIGIAYFPYLDYEYEFEIKVQLDSVETSWLDGEFAKVEKDIEDLKTGNINPNIIEDLNRNIQKEKDAFLKNKDDVDNKQQVLSNLRKHLKEIDDLKDSREWPDLVSTLTKAIGNLVSLNLEKGNEQTSLVVGNLQKDVDQVLRDRDVKSAGYLLDKIYKLTFELEKLEVIIGFIMAWDQTFNEIPWQNPNQAYQAISKAKEIIYDEPTVESLAPIWVDLYNNGQFDWSNDDSSLSSMNNLLKG